MRLINADKLQPDCMTKDGKLAISQSQIANAPTVELPHGEWKLISSDLDFEEYQCSVCGRVMVSYENLNSSKLIKEYPFCHCGARMVIDDE